MSLWKLLFGAKLGPREMTVGEIVGRKVLKSEIKDIVSEEDDKKKAEYNPIIGKLALCGLLAKMSELDKEAPFKSEAQRRKFYAMKSRGEISGSEVAKWEAETPDKKLPERIHKKDAADVKTYPLSRFFTSHGAGAISGAGRGAVITANPAGALIGAGLGAGLTHIDRIINARALRGRIAHGGKALLPAERETVKMIESAQTKKVVKRVAIGAGVGVAGAVGAKKLMEEDVKTSGLLSWAGMGASMLGKSKITRGLGIGAMVADAGVTAAKEMQPQTNAPRMASEVDRLIALTKEALEFHNYPPSDDASGPSTDVKKKSMSKDSQLLSAVSPGATSKGISALTKGPSSQTKGWLGRGISGSTDLAMGEGKMAPGISSDERVVGSAGGSHIQRGV